MTDYISDLIDMGDPSAKVTEVIQDDDTKYVFIEKKVVCMFCPVCDRRMKSKEKRIKQINHPVFQDGFKLILAVTVRKYGTANRVHIMTTITILLSKTEKGILLLCRF